MRRTSIYIFIYLLLIFSINKVQAATSAIEVCTSGCQYSTLQSAVEAEKEGQKVVISSNLSGSSALLNVTFITNPHSVTIECSPNVILNAQNAPYLINGSMSRNFKMTGCTLDGASEFVFNLSTSQTITLKSNTFIGTPVKTTSNTGSTHDSNLFVNSRLIHGLGTIAVVNNVFNNTSSSNATAVRLAPTGTGTVLHNTINGYTYGIEFATPKQYEVYNNIIANTNQVYKITSGAFINTFNTLAYLVNIIRNEDTNPLLDNGNDFTVISGNPRFVDAVLHIDPILSSAIDAGNTTMSLKYDKDGKPRSEQPDIGAYEVANIQ